MSCAQLGGVVGGAGVILGAALVALWRGRNSVVETPPAADAVELERLRSIITTARRLTHEEAVANMLDRAQR